MIKLNS